MNARTLPSSNPSFPTMPCIINIFLWERYFPITNAAYKDIYYLKYRKRKRTAYLEKKILRYSSFLAEMNTSLNCFQVRSSSCTQPPTSSSLYVYCRSYYHNTLPLPGWSFTVKKYFSLTSHCNGARLSVFYIFAAKLKQDSGRDMRALQCGGGGGPSITETR